MRRKKFNNIYQFKITLKYTKPPVWRRIQVPENYTFWDLHVAIQDAMGWEDYHLHEFRLVHPSTGTKGYIGVPDKNALLMSWEVLAGWDQKIASWFSMQNRKAAYLYDFGDGWEHAVVLEKILPRDKNVMYPICIEGRRACPPEDCGSIPGYEGICQGVHEFQEEYKDYDPEHFDPQEIYFDDPEERLKEMRNFM